MLAKKNGSNPINKGNKTNKLKAKESYEQMGDN